MTRRPLAPLLTAVAALGSVTFSFAASPGTDDGAITLSPFEVSSSKDQGYAASSSLAGSRLATELKFIPAPVSVLTREFLDDLAVSDLQESMAWSVNTNVANSSDAGSGSYQNGLSTLSSSNNDIRTRSGIQLNITRNFFRWSVNSDTYNTERLDVSLNAPLTNSDSYRVSSPREIRMTFNTAF